MAEDVEIEYLLKENEQVLKDAANLTQKSNPVSEDCSSSNYAKPSEDESDINDLDFDDQLDGRLIEYKAKENPRFVYTSTVLEGSFEVDDESDVDFDAPNEDENFFINEILADDEPRFSGRQVEELRTQMTNNTPQDESQQALIKLFTAHRLLTEQIDLAKAGIQKFLQELHQNLATQTQIRERLESLTLKPSVSLKEPSFTKCFFKTFGIPYFEDFKGFTPPPNEDTKQKSERGEILLSTLPKMHYWLKPHKKLLEESIKETLVQENRDKLLNETRKMEQKLKSLSGEEEKSVLEEFNKCQNELEQLKSKSFRELVMKENPYREYDWLKYHASVFKGLHSAEECRRYWHVYLKPGINKSSWEAHEDLRLTDLAVKMNFEDWDVIAENLGTNRTAYQCFVHYHTQISTNQDYNKGKWTADEDNYLISVVNASKWGDYIPWAKVAAHMPKRTHSQIYNRWYNCLNPTILKGRFTKEEDLLLLTGVEVYGVSFKEMSALLKNRTPNQLKERFERFLLPKKVTSGTWSLEEDKKLLQLVGIHGEQSWVKISNAMRTRSRTQVRQRYRFIQSRLEKNTSWAPEKIKRRKKRKPDSSTERILKKVKLAKQELLEIERNFKLSPVEKETLCIEKLTELRDKLFMKKYEVKYKKDLVSEVSEEDHSLINCFEMIHQRPNTNKAESVCNFDNVDIVGEIEGLGRVFGLESDLPLYQDEIADNMNLSAKTKTFLLNTIDHRTVKSTQNDSVKDLPSTTTVSTGESLDYKPEGFDDTLEKPEWMNITRWGSNPPIDVSRLNFGEFFKRTMFDYSSGMHQDIWKAIANRVYTPIPIYQHSLSASNEQTLLFMPPNALTTIGMRSIILSKLRLKQKLSIEIEFRNKAKSHLDHFQTLLISLFTYPRVMSFTSMNLTPLEQVCSSSTVKNKSNHRSILNLLENPPREKVSRKVALTDTSNILSGASKPEATVKRTKTTKTPKKSITRQIKKFKDKVSKSGKDETTNQTKTRNIKQITNQQDQKNDSDNQSSSKQEFEFLKFNLPQVTYKRNRIQESLQESPGKKRKLIPSHNVGGILEKRHEDESDIGKMLPVHCTITSPKTTVAAL